MISGLVRWIIGLFWWAFDHFTPVGIAAAATVTYAIFAILQWKAMRRQAEIANKTLILVHRPKLIVRNVQIQKPDMRQITVPDDFRKVQTFMGQLVVPNIGSTTANIVHAGCWVFLIEGELPMERPYESLQPNAKSFIQGRESKGNCCRATPVP